MENIYSENVMRAWRIYQNEMELKGTFRVHFGIEFHNACKEEGLDREEVEKDLKKRFGNLK